jgi:hypothetical protein
MQTVRVCRLEKNFPEQVGDLLEVRIDAMELMEVE